MREITDDSIQTRWALLEASITRTRFTGTGWMCNTSRPHRCSGLVFTWKSATRKYIKCTETVHTYNFICFSIYNIRTMTNTTQSSSQLHSFTKTNIEKLLYMLDSSRRYCQQVVTCWQYWRELSSIGNSLNNSTHNSSLAK